MRAITIIIFLILTSCNSQNKNSTPTEMWTNFIKVNSDFASDEIPESESFHNNKEDADRLADLILKGKKKAGSSMYALYEKFKVALPQVGKKQIVTDFDGNAQAIIEIVKVDTIPFNRIAIAYAELDMGTDDEPLKKWKKAHWDFFESFTKESGIKPTEDMLIVCTWFETIWPTNK